MAKNIRHIIKGFDHGTGSIADAPGLVQTLRDYARTITPWATSVARYMLADVARRNERMWREHSAQVGRALRAEIQGPTATGEVFRWLLMSQVELIQSLPLKSAERVHRLVQEGMPAGTRSTTIAQEILETANIAEWRARLIARTEVSRASQALVQARALKLGSEGYIWRTVGDSDVRDVHKKMEGKFVRWDSPPKTDPSLDPYHAGCGPNCRCYSEPVLPDY